MTDTKVKSVTKHTLTDNPFHTSQVLEDLLDEKNKGQKPYVDSPAYRGRAGQGHCQIKQNERKRIPQ